MSNRKGWFLGNPRRGGRGGGWFPTGRGPRGGSSGRGPRGGRGGRGGAWSKDDHDRYQNQPWRQNRPFRDMPTKRLSEEEIFATEYVTPGEGFHGIIKSRYADFQVSEISPGGEVAQLTDLTCPKPPEDEEEQLEEDDEVLLSKYNLEILPLTTWDKINSLAIGAEPVEDPFVVDVTGMTKEHRGKIHESVKKAFGDVIVSSTVSSEDKKFVSFQKYREGLRVDKRVKWPWPAEFVHFIVHKENCDTMEAATKIGERMQMKATVFGYAGTKDRRAKTTQWFSLRRTYPKRIADACEGMREIKVGNFTFKDHQLKLGMLSGNKFQIALRNVTADESVIDEACKALLEKGFVNYYGLQRFGTRYEVPTFNIGLKILKGEYKEAILSILEDKEGPLQRAVQTYKTSFDAEAACRFVSRYNKNTTVEGKLLVSLANEPNDFVGALGKINRNTRLLYIHSYQSLIWNRCVSERIRKFGLKPAVGDLVPKEKINVDLCLDVQEDVESDSEENSEKKAYTDGNTDTTNDKQNTDSQNQSDKTDIDSDKHPENGTPKKKKMSKNEPDRRKEMIQVKVLTEEDVNSGKYSILDVILPLPGCEVVYPPNMVDFYEELLKNDGLTLKVDHRIKSYRLSGAYRRAVVLPQQLRWSHTRYSDPTDELILSDWDILQGKTLNNDHTGGKYRALILTMTLPASCYATMTLRELLKRDTSSNSQAKFNDYHKTEKRKADDTSETEHKDGGSEAKKIKEEVEIKSEME